MTESQVLSQISAAFQPYVKSPNELQAIRSRISRYIETLQPRDGAELDDGNKFAAPDHVTGTRRRYLKAIHANALARQRHTQLRSQIQQKALESDELVTSDDAVSSHLELLKLRRQNQQYRILSSYASEAEKLAEQNDVLELQTTNEAYLNNQLDDSSLLDTSELTAEAQESTRRLEIAILQANHQLKREKQQLDEVKSGQAITPRLVPAAKLHALKATRTELTRWIEESLARCDLSENATAAFDADESNIHIEAIDHEQKISESYDRYIEARERLLAAASMFSNPLPELESATSLNVRKPPYHGRSSSANINIGQLTESQSEETFSILPRLMTTYLPLHLLKIALAQSESHLSLLLARNTQDLTEQLFRLSDESHLLPSYPILARNKSRIKNNAPRGEEFGEAEKLLEAWQFAMQAASTATEATAEKQLREGETSIDQVLALVKQQRDLVEILDEME